MTHLWPSNPSQWTGIVVFTLAALACAAVRGRAVGRWGVMAGVQAAWVLELFLEGRFALRAAGIALFRAADAYGSRVPWQVGLLVLLCAASGAGLIVLSRQRGTAWRIACLAAGGQAATLLAEAVSLHQLDTWLYRGWAGVAFIAWGWVGLSAVVIVAALAAARAGLSRPGAPGAAPPGRAPAPAPSRR
ncbi:hypothetical protein [Aquabacterium sp. J223]|uniref:hypothetical protein n=1 Tax=Aquabacterium sp. J223 TaxID=2898431 RepID=UPI0021ADC3A5|nr:hypothetical protein [Aquabacterium sp. J223]UUX94943.1 hypothetical protein LRS07_17080 [Aquabacterium sp. J223]